MGDTSVRIDIEGLEKLKKVNELILSIGTDRAGKFLNRDLENYPFTLKDAVALSAEVVLEMLRSQEETE